MSNLPEKHSLSSPSLQRVRDLLDAAYSKNTQKAYRSDIASFLHWGGSIPSTAEDIAAYIADKAQTCSVATIRRHLASLSNLHSSLHCAPNPLKSSLIAATVRGLTRLHGMPQRASEPLLIEDLRVILDKIPSTVVGKRDAALLTIGFAGGMRRSEVVALDFEDIECVSAGIKLMIRRSKTDQAGRGRTIAIPYGRTRYCPVKYLQTWSEIIDVKNGPIFRSCSKGGIVADRRLSSEAVSAMIKKHARNIGLNPAKYSGHSLRAGYVTSAIQAGAAEHVVRRQTGHASYATMERYIHLANLFEDNAVSLLF